MLLGIPAIEALLYLRLRLFVLSWKELSFYDEVDAGELTSRLSFGMSSSLLWPSAFPCIFSVFVSFPKESLGKSCLCIAYA